MTYIALLYIFSKEDKFLFLLATIDGEVIEQMFYVSRLKKSLLRFPSAKTVNNISDFILALIKCTNNTNRNIDTNDAGTNDSSQTSVKSVFHNLSDCESKVLGANNNS